MAGFLYYVPQRKAFSRAEARRRGLEHAFPADAVSWREVSAGPDGEAGAVWAAEPERPEARPAAIGYFPDRQTWAPAIRDPQAGEETPPPYWIGYETDQPPRPEDLQRGETVAGHRVKLADGNEWIVPVARCFPAGTALPESLVLGPDGQVVREVLPQYAGLWTLSERAWQAWVDAQSGGPAEMDEGESFRMAAQALAVNYRVGPQELSLLRALTTANLREVILALIDVPTIRAVARELESAKKKEASAGTPAGDSSRSGGRDS